MIFKPHLPTLRRAELLGKLTLLVALSMQVVHLKDVLKSMGANQGGTSCVDLAVANERIWVPLVWSLLVPCSHMHPLVACRLSLVACLSSLVARRWMCGTTRGVLVLW
jgi:hypothetical protein